MDGILWVILFIISVAAAVNIFECIAQEVKMSNDTNTKTPVLISDSDYSKVHNESVMDPLIAKMRDAGFTGTVGNMIQEACELKKEAEMKSRVSPY